MDIGKLKETLKRLRAVCSDLSAQIEDMEFDERLDDLLEGKDDEEGA